MLGGALSDTAVPYEVITRSGRMEDLLGHAKGSYGTSSGALKGPFGALNALKGPFRAPVTVTTAPFAT